MARGYLEGPAAEEAQRRLDELVRGVTDQPSAESQAAVFGSTEDNPEPHFLGLVGAVDPEELFASGAAWGVTVRRVAAS
jgi:hypothetical protein